MPIDDHAQVSIGEFKRLPLIGVPVYGTLEKCDFCKFNDEWPIQNHGDGNNYILLTSEGFICKMCLDKKNATISQTKLPEIKGNIR